MDTTEEDWTLVISPRRGAFDVPIREVLAYRDLVTMLTKRNFVARYKQTILGPLWLIIQPLMTTGIFTIVFGEIANLSTDGIPQVLFYLSGVTCWTYFATTLTSTSNTFRENANLFGKVYFPRLIVPIATAVSNGLTLAVQLVLLLSVAAYMQLRQPIFDVQAQLLLLPLFVLIMAAAALGIGMAISSMTAKYRDLAYLVGFGVQLLMYATPVIYPLSAIPERYRTIAGLNPVAHVIEGFRHALFGTGTTSAGGVLYALASSLVVFTIGLLAFNQVERKFVDTI